MNASQLITDKMTLEEKLAAIDSAMENAMAEAQQVSGAPVDPADLTMCFGCE